RLGPLPLTLLRHRDLAGFGARTALSIASSKWIASGICASGRQPLARALTLAFIRTIVQREAHRAVAIALLLIAVLATLGAELRAHRLAHLPAALLPRLDRLLLRLARAGLVAFAQLPASLAHRRVGLAKAGRHLAGQVAELLHQLAQRPAQRLLHAA